MLFGMREMRDEHVEVRWLLAALTMKLTNSSAAMSAHAIGEALYGLQGMTSESSEVQQLLNVLTARMQESEVELSASQIINACCGMRRMSCVHGPVRNFLQVLAAKIASSSDSLSEFEAGLAVEALQALDDGTKDISNVIAAIRSKIIVTSGNNE
jgi:predicted nucleic acid-binding protein